MAQLSQVQKMRLPPRVQLVLHNIRLEKRLVAVLARVHPGRQRPPVHVVVRRDVPGSERRPDLVIRVRLSAQNALVLNRKVVAAELETQRHLEPLRLRRRGRRREPSSLCRTLARSSASAAAALRARRWGSCALECVDRGVRGIEVEGEGEGRGLRALHIGAQPMLGEHNLRAVRAQDEEVGVCALALSLKHCTSVNVELDEVTWGPNGLPELCSIVLLIAVADADFQRDGGGVCDVDARALGRFLVRVRCEMYLRKRQLCRHHKQFSNILFVLCVLTGRQQRDRVVRPLFLQNLVDRQLNVAHEIRGAEAIPIVYVEQQLPLKIHAAQCFQVHCHLLPFRVEVLLDLF
mmetsp:Transcript_61077/g.144116  ORF Transcript_61077/g.144116 Transcript_61077/m.144116 type:complete len:349 (-) Transcript_61077:382-1428(-)